MEYAILYVEINLMATALIGIILYKTGGISRMVAQRNFSMTIVAEMVFFLSDMFFVMVETGLLPYSGGALILSKMIYFLATTMMCFLWFVYFEYMQGSPFVQSPRNTLYSSCLVWIMVVLLIINLFNGMLFYIDADGVYRRGPYFLALYVLSYTYVFFTCLRALIGVFNKNRTTDRKLLITLALFPVLPAIAGILQFLYPDFPFACFALSIETLIMYLNWIDQMISLDPLTSLNNRKQLNHNYEQWFKNRFDDEDLYLLLIDANKFKQINDTYGHIQGDAALVRIAEALRKACKGLPKRANIARYGGDEFVVLMESAGVNDAALALKQGIINELEALNDEANTPFRVTVSIGIAHASVGSSLKELISIADQEMYKEKSTRS